MPVKVKRPFLFLSLVTFILSFQVPDLQRRDVAFPFFLPFKAFSGGPWVQLLYSGPESFPRRTMPQNLPSKDPGSPKTQVKSCPTSAQNHLTSSKSPRFCGDPEAHCDLPSSLLLRPVLPSSTPLLLFLSPSLLPRMCHSLCSTPLATWQLLLANSQQPPASDPLHMFPPLPDIQAAPAVPSFKSAFVCHLMRKILLNRPLKNSRIKTMIIKQSSGPFLPCNIFLHNCHEYIYLSFAACLYPYISDRAGHREGTPLSPGPSLHGSQSIFVE